LLDQLEGTCRTKVATGVIESVNGNLKALLRRCRGYRDRNDLLLKVQRSAATKAQIPCSAGSRVMSTVFQILVPSR
jgi:hypothetical protein